ncbi:hypothetical protein BCV70DRAFT_220256 [Testicularia cyperi]|uniref:Uncharacterized protein n=1 Tax=Testicularia cyperi TaxID=1882483 RepID=A0A317XZL0_9BASI|nr:hypothetical protein BCV70DRAFT_220256 [Testicularia cyperi]
MCHSDLATHTSTRCCPNRTRTKSWVCGAHVPKCFLWSHSDTVERYINFTALPKRESCFVSVVVKPILRPLSIPLTMLLSDLFSFVTATVFLWPFGALAAGGDTVLVTQPGYKDIRAVAVPAPTKLTPLPPPVPPRPAFDIGNANVIPVIDGRNSQPVHANTPLAAQDWSLPDRLRSQKKGYPGRSRLLADGFHPDWNPIDRIRAFHIAYADRHITIPLWDYNWIFNGRQAGMLFATKSRLRKMYGDLTQTKLKPTEDDPASKAFTQFLEEKLFNAHGSNSFSGMLIDALERTKIQYSFLPAWESHFPFLHRDDINAIHFLLTH